MSNNEITSKLQKISITILTGILGIVVFINTALVQQAPLMGAEEVELQMILKGINTYSFVLIFISIFFFLVAMPIEEIWVSMKRLLKKNSETFTSTFIFNFRLILFIVGVTGFSGIFIFYLIRFAGILI